MALESSNEVILCKVFSTTLVSSALIWFCQLLERSINGFEAFCALFMKKYSSHRRQVKTMRDLHMMEQKNNETPQEYLNRFMEVMNEIYDMDLKEATISFMHGLILGLLFSDKLLEELPRDMNVVIQKAEGVFRVLESRQKMTKSIALIYAPNASALSLQLSQGGNKRNEHYDLTSRDKS